VFVVGHDWGAQVAWHLCLFRPDRVRAVVALGVPYFPRHPRPMTEVFAAFGDGFYITQFQVLMPSSLSRLLQPHNHTMHLSSGIGGNANFQFESWFTFVSKN